MKNKSAYYLNYKNLNPGQDTREQTTKQTHEPGTAGIWARDEQTIARSDGRYTLLDRSLVVAIGIPLNFKR